MKPAIEVTGIGKSYIINHKQKADTLKDDIGNILKGPFAKKNRNQKENFWALKDISFEINQGEIFGIIGRNGSGKSTLLKILSRIVDPTEGRVVLRGRTASLLEVGTGFHPELTGRENVYMNGSMLGLSRQQINARFNEIVEFSEIERFIDTPVKFYSSGMYVRLAFSVAAHLEPDILILDEVLSVGDAGFQQKSLNKILSTMEEGRTVLFVSHSMGAVRQLCTKGILLKDGQIACQGNVEDIIEQYSQVVGDELPDAAPTEWKNDGSTNNDYFVPHEMYVIDQDGKRITKPVKNNVEHAVVISGEIKQESDIFSLGYAVYNENNGIIYQSLHTDHNKSKPLHLKKGPIQLVGKIPQHFLNGGSYRIGLIGGLHNRFWLFEPGTHTPVIDFQISGGLSDSTYWKAPRAGSNAPLLDWEIK